MGLHCQNGRSGLLAGESIGKPGEESNKAVKSNTIHNSNKMQDLVMITDGGKPKPRQLVSFGTPFAHYPMPDLT